MTLSVQRSALANQEAQRVVLMNVSWQTYQALLKDLGCHRASRLTYDQGVLEIFMPSELHEIINRLLALMITVLTDELGMKIKGYSSTTLDREDLERGIEPDSWFYIQNVDSILGRQFDPATSPPPDLAIEVDIMSSSQRRFGVYHQLQIPEIWRYTEERGVVIFQLQADGYMECEVSPTFPMVSGAMLMEFLQLAKSEDDNAVMRELRQWIRSR